MTASLLFHSTAHTAWKPDQTILVATAALHVVRAAFTPMLSVVQCTRQAHAHSKTGKTSLTTSDVSSSLSCKPDLQCFTAHGTCCPPSCFGCEYSQADQEGTQYVPGAVIHCRPCLHDRLQDPPCHPHTTSKAVSLTFSSVSSLRCTSLSTTSGGGGLYLRW